VGPALSDRLSRESARTPLLEVQDLHVRFETSRGTVHAVNGISYDVNRGETVAIVGESGCGKSVSALAIMRLLAANTARIPSGRILFEGRNLLALSSDDMRAVRGRDIAMIFQEPMSSLNPLMTIGDQIAEAIMLHDPTGREVRRAKVLELLRLVGIPDPAGRIGAYPHQFSGGMRQRVMIAMALACDPKILIADEPTTALDVTIQAGILDLMRDLRERIDTAIILITHNLGVVADIADRVIVMYAGRKAEEAPVRELFARPQHPYTIGLLGAIPRPGEVLEDGGRRRLQEIPGRVPSLAELPQHCAFADRCSRADGLSRSQVPELRQVRPNHLVACFHPGENGPA
jgi:peptide/nickel transport system ATP-binding protein